MVDSHSVAHLIVGGLLGASGDGVSVGCGSDRAQQVIRAIADRPYVGSAQICKELGITREELRAVYAQARVNPAMQAVLAKSAGPFHFTPEGRRLFDFTSRGRKQVKGKGEMGMYFVERA